MKRILILLTAAMLILTLCSTCFAETETRIGASKYSITIPDEYNMKDINDEWDGLIKYGDYNGIEIRFTMIGEDEHRDAVELFNSGYMSDGQLIRVNNIDCIKYEMDCSMYQNGMMVGYTFIDDGYEYYVEFQDTTEERDIEQVREIAEPIWNTIQ